MNHYKNLYVVFESVFIQEDFVFDQSGRIVRLDISYRPNLVEIYWRR